MTDRMTGGWALAGPERGVVNADHPMLAGHFPGHPIVPGAWLLAWVVVAATQRLAATGHSLSIEAIKRVKFLRPLAPDNGFECTLNLRLSAEGAEVSNDTMRFTVSSGGGVIAEGSLQLQQRVD